MNPLRTYFFVSLMLLLVSSAANAQFGNATIEKGVEAFGNEQWDDAMEYFQEALSEDPDDPQLNFNLGAANYKKERYEDALASFEKALLTQEVKLQEQAYFNKGNTLYQLGKFAEAIESYKKALDLIPEDEDSKYNLELVRAKLKEMADKQEQKQDENQQQENIEPSEFARQLKAEADRLKAENRFKDACNLLLQGMNSDPTVKAYQDYIKRLQDIVEIEEKV